MQLLKESVELNQTFERNFTKRKILVIFSICIGIGFIDIYFLAYYDFYRETLKQTFLQTIMQLQANQTVSIMDFFLQHSLLYGEWLMRQTLIDLKQIQDKTSMNSIIKTIENVAKFSHQFHMLQSIPLLLFWLNNMMDMIMMITLRLIKEGDVWDYRMNIFVGYIILMVIYNIYIVNVNENMLIILDQIIEQIRYREQSKRFIRNHTNLIRSYEVLDQYRSCFELKLFYMTKMNKNIMLSMALAVVALVVFLLQTK